MSLPKTSTSTSSSEPGSTGSRRRGNLAEGLRDVAGTGCRRADVIVLDKTNVGAGASGIACGVVRNNYFQPAMRELMEHSVSVWESDPDAFSYHGVGYMQLAPEVMHGDVAQIYEEQRSIGYPSTLVEGEAECRVYMENLFSDWQAKNITLRPPREARRLRQQRRLHERAGRQGKGAPASGSSRARRCSGSAATAPAP